jgi:hypothetical protein
MAIASHVHQTKALKIVGRSFGRLHVAECLRHSDGCEFSPRRIFDRRNSPTWALTCAWGRKQHSEGILSLLPLSESSFRKCRESEMQSPLLITTCARYPRMRGGTRAQLPSVTADVLLGLERVFFREAIRYRKPPIRQSKTCANIAARRPVLARIWPRWIAGTPADSRGSISSVGFSKCRTRMVRLYSRAILARTYIARPSWPG